jgi:Uma2 family endonuclease
MGIGALISEDEYLHTTYSPDYGFADGVLIERNVGTESHSWLQGALASYFFSRRKLWGITPYTEQRIKIRSGKYMIPDLCVILGPRAKESILTSPPLLVIEILSPEDRPGRVKKTIQEWRDFGVPYVWSVDPETLESELYDGRGRTRLEDGVLRIPGTPIEVALRLLDED